MTVPDQRDEEEGGTQEGQHLCRQDKVRRGEVKEGKGLELVQRGTKTLLVLPTFRQAL